MKIKKILSNIPGKTLAFCVFLVFLLGFLLFAPFPESPKPDKESSSAEVGNNASPQITPPKDALLSNSFPANQAVTSVVSPASEVRLRGKTEEKEMRLRHENALKSLGLPPVNNALPRRPLAKEPLVQPPGFEHQLLVKFQDTLLARASREGGLIISSDHVDSQLMQIIREHGLRFKPNHTVGELDLARLEAEALFATREQPADLGGMLQVMPTRSDKDSVWSAAKALQSLGVIEFVSLSSMDQPPPPPQAFDIAPPTDALSSTQTYRGSAGINIDEAWSQFGAKGANVRVTDCEYYFNPNHEDMAGLVSPQPGVSSYYTGFGDDHGTAVLGILTAADNNYGMTGMVPLATARFYPDHATVNGVYQSRSACITAALIASSRGDVVLLEMQTRGAGATDADGRYVPAEYDQTVWTVVKTGTDAGKHVVAAAGNGGTNGGENLDSTAYSTYRNRGDSGSIIVGAADTSRARLSYSTYGARVNLQGWGAWNVATLGYGNYRTYGSDHNQKYTNSFSGTSSASPIVTAAVVAVESVARQRLGRSLTPSEMRQLLAQTGKPQTGDLSTKIGPLPNVSGAIASMLGVAIQRTLTLSAVNGSIQASPAKSTYNDNESVTLTALPNAGYEFIGWSGDLGGITNPAGLVMSSNRVVTALFAPIFGSDALSPSGLTFTRGGNGTWFMQSVVKPANIDAAARSGNTDANSTSWFETSVAGPGTLRYWRKVSSESGFDLLRVLLNGNQIDGASWSGEQDWQEQTVNIPAGNHTVRWQYSKDGSVDRGLDAAFIARVVYQNIPATSPPDLFIRSLGTTNATVIDHNSLTGDDRGGIALSANRVFVNGDESAARFNLADLGGGMSVGRKLDGLCSDLETRTVYTLALDGVPYASGGTLVNQLIQLDGTTGNLTSTVIALSSSVTLSSNTSIGIFSGRGRVLIHNGSRVYDVRLPSGIVIDLGAMAKPAWRNTEISAVWGVAESFEGSLFLAYRANSGNSFLRSRIPNGATELISNFTNLNDLASWSIDLPSNRWFFHHEESAQFGGGIETLGFASGNFGTTRSAPVVQNPMSTNGMVGSWFSFQILASHGPTFFSAAFLPSGLFMDASTGLISGAPLEAGVWTVPLSVSNSAGTMNSTLQITISPPPPVIDSAFSVNGTIGTAFSYQITATNSPTSFAADGLPSGLSLDTATGLISGTPSAPGNSTVWLYATNSGGTGNATLTISIAGAPPVINSPLSANGTVGAFFNYQILATNAPSSFGATGLPNGLSLNPSTGMISGIPTTAGNSTVTLSATNSSGTSNATLLVSIVAPIPVINSATHVNGTLGSIFSYQITATNSPSSFAAIGLPPGLTLNATTGVIGGTPTAAGNSTVTLSATNSSGTGNATLFVTISAGLPFINSPTSASGTVGSAFSYLMTATNNPTSFGAGGLPTGLAINSSTGAISGIPRAAGNFSINASATNSGGTSSRMLSFNLAKGVQTISGVTPFASRLLGAAAYSLNATVNSGLAITYASSNTSVAAISANGTVSILGAGTTTLTAVQNGDANWNPAPGVSQTLTVTIPIVPTLSVTPSSLGDFNATSGTPSTAQKFDVSGTDLEGAVNLSAPAGYEISRDGNSYSSSLTINPDLPVLASDSASNYGFSGPTGWANGSNRGTGFSSWSFTVVNNPPAFYAGAFIGDPAAAEITNMPSPAFGLYANPGNTGASVTVSRSFAQPLAVGDFFSFQWATNWDSDVGNKGFNIFAGGVEVVNINQAGYPGNITCNGQLAIDGASGYGTSPMTWTFTRTSPTNLQVTSTARNGTSVLAFSTNITISAAPSGFSLYASAMAAGNDQRQPYFNNFRIVSTTVTGGNLTKTPVFVRLSAGAPTGPASGNITVTSANATQRTLALTGNMAILRTLAVNPPGPISLSTTFNLASSATPVAVTGTNLTENITATAPANFEVSTSNSSFGSSATLLPAGGNLFLRIASTAPVGFLSGNLSLASGEVSKSLVLLGMVVGSGFDAWPMLLDLPAGRRGMLDRNGPQDLPNLLAYAMGLNPLTANAADLPATANFNAAARTIDITYRRAKNLPDVSLTVEGSSSLTGGFSPASVLSESVLVDGTDHQTIRATISIPTGSDRYFLRLRANGTP